MPTTLISIVSSMALIGMLALLAVPSIESTTLDRYNATPKELEYLISLARDRSASTGFVHGVRWDRDSRTFDVVRADYAQTPPVIIETIPDPVSKQLARYVVPGEITVSPDAPFIFTFMGTVPLTTLYFDAWGTPVNRVMGTNLQLQTGLITFRAGTWQGAVQVQPVTGRIVVN